MIDDVVGDDDDKKHVICNYVMTVVIESSVKFDVLLQNTLYSVPLCVSFSYLEEFF
jgi:hypothetical protein